MQLQSKPLIIRKNKLFCIEVTELPQSAKKAEVINELYYEIHKEFAGAEYNDKYKNLTYAERIQRLNEFARDWLQKKGHK